MEKRDKEKERRRLAGKKENRKKQVQEKRRRIGRSKHRKREEE